MFYNPNSLLFIVALIGYFAEAKVWLRWGLLLLAAPLAIVANSLRVAVSGAFPYLAEGTPHQISGLVIFGMTLTIPILILAAYARIGSHE